MHHSPPGSSVRGILQARVLEWIAIPFSRVSFWPRDWTRVFCISCIGRRILYHCTTWEPRKTLKCQRILRKKNKEDSNVFLRKSQMTMKITQYHELSGKCKLKPQWNAKSHTSEWLLSKDNVLYDQNSKNWWGCREVGTLIELEDYWHWKWKWFCDPME